MEQTKAKVSSFDFYGKEEENQKQEQLKLKTKKLNQFKKMGMIAVGSVLSLSLLGWGISELYEGHEKRIAAQIIEKENLVKNTPIDPLLNAMTRETQLVNTTFANNQLLIAKYSTYTPIIEFLNLQTNVNQKIQSNTNIRDTSLRAIAESQVMVKEVSGAIIASPEVKKDILLSQRHMSDFEKWSQATKSQTPIYTQSIISLGKEIEGQLDLFKTTQQDITKIVQDKIGKKDFDLNAAQNKISSQITNEGNSQLSELRQARREVAGTDQTHLLTDYDVQKAETAVNSLTREALDKVSQDKEKVQQLVSNPQALQQNNSSFDLVPLLLAYAWLNSGSNNISNVAPATASLLNSNTKNMYSINSSSSYLNKSLNNNQATDISSIRSQISTAKNRAQQAVMAKQEDVRRRAEFARRAEEQRRDEIRREQVEEQRRVQQRERAAYNEAKKQNDIKSNTFNRATNTDTIKKQPSVPSQDANAARRAELSRANAQRQERSSVSSTRIETPRRSNNSSSSSGSSSGSRTYKK